MAATVFVWEPKADNFGHVSLSLRNGPYISWWPSDSIDGKLGSKTGNYLLGSKAISSTISKDRYEEGNRNPDWASAPIKGLDEEAIKTWWVKKSGRFMDGRNRKTVMSTNSRYNVLSDSCAGVVFEALEIGGLYKFPYASAVAAGFSPVITPINIKDLACAITGEVGLFDVARQFIPGSVRALFNYRNAILEDIL